MEATPSRFELLTAAAFVYFAEVGADVAVIEVGLLGRFDATNVIDADVAVITNIGKDHTDGIGDWQVKVAREKAGIIKPPSHVVLGSPFGELRSVIDGEESAAVWELGTDVEILANELGVGGRIISVSTPLGVYDDIFLPVFGEHQGSNLATALAATDAFFGRPLDRDLVDAALAEIELPGRFEVVSREPTVILDGGHNPDGLAVVKQTLDEAFARIGSWVLVLGFLGGKDPAEMLEAVDAADFDAVIVCTPSWSRAIPAEVVASAAARIGVDVEIVADPVEAFRRARAVSSDEDLILVTGSMYIVGNVRSVARSLAESPAFED
jgi:dihydrofolate synthase/folylpolyglutamate synthase